MNRPLTIYSPAPPATRLHALNVAFGALIAARGVANQVVAMALPDSINAIAHLRPEDRAYHLPIVTPVDFAPARDRTGPPWHAYERASSDLKLLAGLYDVAFGVMALRSGISKPDELQGCRVAAPPRPSSVRLLSEALLFDAFDLKGQVEIVDARPTDLRAMLDAGEIDATTWNITTLESAAPVPAVPWLSTDPDVHWLAVSAADARRLSASHPFVVESCWLNDVSLLSFRQGLAVWDETPHDICAAILDALACDTSGLFWRGVRDWAHWPGGRSDMLHPILSGWQM